MVWGRNLFFLEECIILNFFQKKKEMRKIDRPSSTQQDEVMNWAAQQSV
jgi:hypothetical protein